MSESAGSMIHMKQGMIERLQGFVDGRTIPDRSPPTLEMLSTRFVELCRHSQIQLPDDQARLLFAETVNDIVGYGPLDPYPTDDSVTEVMANRPTQIYKDAPGGFGRRR